MPHRILPASVGPMAVSDEQIEAFRRDGAVCVRGAFTADEVALVERGIERNLADPSPRALVASRPDDTGRLGRAALPRPHAGQGAGHSPADAVAPGSALLQRRRIADVQRLDARRPRLALLDARV